MSDGLPPGWDAKWDPRLGRWYYVNHSLRTTQWEDPRLQFGNSQPDTQQKLIDEAKQLFNSDDDQSDDSKEYERTKREAEEELIDEVIQLCCPELEDDQSIRAILKQMIINFNGDREEILRAVKEMLGKNNEPISKDNSDDGQSDGFDPEEYERAKREAEEEARRIAEERQREEEETQKKEAEERRLRLEKQEKMKLERQRAREEETKRRKERANMLRQQNSSSFAADFGGAFGASSKRIEDNIISSNSDTKDLLSKPSRNENIFKDEYNGPRALGPSGINKGPDKSLRNGRNKSLVNGPDKSLRTGPDRTLARGPNIKLLSNRQR